MFVEDIIFRAAEATQLPPQVLAEEVICLDSTSSGSEDDTKGKNSIKDGKWPTASPLSSHSSAIYSATRLPCSSSQMFQ